MKAKHSASDQGVMRDEWHTPKGPDVYKKDSDFQEKWHSLQEKLRCCGWKKIGYSDYNAVNGCIPNSCVIEEKDRNGNARKLDSNCPNQFTADDQKKDLWDKIWMQGCIFILKQKFKNELTSGKYLILLELLVMDRIYTKSDCFAKILADLVICSKLLQHLQLAPL